MSISGGVVLGCGKTRWGRGQLCTPGAPNLTKESKAGSSGIECGGFSPGVVGASSGLAPRPCSFLSPRAPVQGSPLCQGGELFPESMVQEELESLEAQQASL